MPIPRRRATATVGAVAALLLAVLVAACGADAAPSSAAATAAQPVSRPPGASVAPVVPPSAGVAAVAYSGAMCPIFASLIELDPQLAALRAIGRSGGDVTEATGEMESASAALLDVLTALEEVPSWGPGDALRFHLITGLHAIRTELLAIIAEPGARTASDLLAELPLIATEAMDRSMGQAAAAGLNCGTGA